MAFTIYDQERISELNTAFADQAIGELERIAREFVDGEISREARHSHGICLCRKIH